jgi:glycosyltransferase involved in cell wall biosynthesis
MKIAYLLGSLNRGGTETLLLDVFRNAKQNALDAMGIYRKSGSLESDFRQSGVEMVQLPVEKNPLAYLIQLRRLLVRNKISIVHAQQPIDALFAWLACLGTGMKIVLTFHGYDFNDEKKGALILRFIIKRTDTNIFVSETQRQYYQQRYSLKYEKQTVVYNGISFDKLDVSITRTTTSSHPESNLRNELHISPNTLLIGSVGNFVPVRDQLTLCRFLKLLNEQEVDFHFIFVGKRAENKPDLYDNCYNFCQQNNLLDRVAFLGSRNDVPELLQQLDAFLYATDHDTFGIAVVEAMAAGIPVFVNDWEVMTEITNQGKYVTLYKTKEEVDLLQQFMLFLQDKTPYKTKALEAIRFVREKYSVEKHIENLKQVYSQQ